MWCTFIFLLTWIVIISIISLFVAPFQTVAKSIRVSKMDSKLVR